MSVPTSIRPEAPAVGAFAWELEADPVRRELLHWRQFREEIDASVQNLIAQSLRTDLLDGYVREIKRAIRAQLNQLMDLDRRIAVLEGRLRCSAP